jgi:TonB family protein
MRTPRSNRLVSWVVGLVVLLGAARVHAQSSGAAPGAAPQPVVTMPVAKKSDGAAYPKQALDEGLRETVEVPVIITVDAAGAVTNAVLEKPVGHGFDEAALAAAKALEFEPATRDGRPVAARTRIVYKFAPPASVLSGRVATLMGGEPIAGATVTVTDSAGGAQTVTASAAGDWRIEGLAPGTYRLRVVAPGKLAHESGVDLKPGEEANVVDRLAPEEQGPASGGSDASIEEMAEVQVHGKKPPREVVKRTLEQREINRIPGTGGDALRSLLNLPGVARPPPLSGLLVVRGSAPQDSQIFVDGTPIPIVYHFGGVTSVLPTEVIDKIDFYPGNFSTQFGRAMGAVVDVGLASPRSDRLHAKATVSVLDAAVLAQGPVLDTGWRFSLAGRRSYVDAILGPVLTAAGASVSVAPVYYDYQAILERDLSKRSSVRFAVIGSDDRLALLLTNTSSGNPTLAGSLSTHVGFWVGQALYKYRLTDQTEFRAVAGVGQNYVDFSLGNIFFNLTSWPVTGRAEMSHKLDSRLTLNVGLDMEYFPYTLSARLPPLPRQGQPPPGPFSSQVPRDIQVDDSLYMPAAYLEWEATPWRGTRIVPGLRLDHTKDTKSWDLDPRILVRQDVTTSPRTTLKAAVGLFSQAPQPQETNSVLGTPGLSSNRAYHYDVGVERQFTDHVNATVDVFYKQLDHLVVQGLGNTGSGVIYGAETLVRYTPDDRFFGWLAYTLSRSTRRDAPGMPLRLTPFDETHVLTVLGSYILGRGWQLGARFRLTSGYMYTPEQYGFYDENVGTYIPVQAYPLNQSRLPTFHSLDIRIDKTWTLPWGSIGAFLDCWNVYNSGNVAGIGYDFNDTHRSYVNDLPILPILGLNVEM